MRNFFLTLAAGLTLMASATPAVVFTNRVDEGLHATFTPNFKTERHAQNSPLKAAGEITVEPKIINAPGDELTMVMLIRTEADGSLTVFVGEKNSQTGKISFKADEGTYDALCIGTGQGSTDKIYIFKENVTVNATTMPEFKSADANKSVHAINYGPDGKEVITDTPDADSGCMVDVALYNGITFYYGSHSYKYPLTGSIIRTNDPANTKFTLLRSQFLATTEAFLVAGFPIDFSKETIGSTADGWQMGRMNFGSNPTFQKYEDFKNMMIEAGEVTEEETAYAMSYYGIIVDGEIFGESGQGIFAPGYDAAKVAIWAPEGECPIQHYIYSSACQLTGFDSGVNSTPLVRGDKGLEVAGVVRNNGFLSYFTADKANLNPNPLYSGTPTTALLGNCAPSVVMSPHLDQMQIETLGRHGEELAVDSWNIYDNIDPEGIEPIFGGVLPNEVFVFAGDKQLNNNRSQFPNMINWYNSGTYRVEYSTTNVLVDGEIQGNVKATLKYDRATWDKTTPSVTVVSIFDKEGNINDRLEDAADGVLSFYAADIRYMQDDSDATYLYYRYGDVAEVTAEYAPYGSEDFKALPVEANPEGDFFPGFGYNFRASLEGITERSTNGWFDIRLTVNDAFGSSMVQTISPAFYVSSLASIDYINAEQNEEATYYNLQGIRVANPQPGQIVIERKKGTARKIMF